MTGKESVSVRVKRLEEEKMRFENKENQTGRVLGAVFGLALIGVGFATYPIYGIGRPISQAGKQLVIKSMSKK